MEGNTLKGHAAVFDQVADLGMSFERLAPTAFDKALRTSDARALLNHDPRLVLGRQSAGTLSLRTDKVGLAFEIDLPDTSYAADLRTLVGRGDLSGASFGFIPGEMEFEKTKDGRNITTHTSISELVDVSPVTFPAYEGTDVSLRYMDLDQLPGPSARQQAALIRARQRSRQ